MHNSTTFTFINLFKVVKYILPFLTITLFPIKILMADEIENSNPRAFMDMSNINTQHDEFAPTVSPDGKFLLFNSKRDRDKYQDIYISYFENNQWKAPRKFTLLNSRYNDETPYISKDGLMIIFSSDRDGSKEMAKNRKGQIRVSFDLYYSKKEGNKWSKPRPLPGDVNTAHHERAPSISADNKTIYFSRWEFGNILSASVHHAELFKGKYYSKGKLPRAINSGNQEVALVPDNHQTGFYFSTKKRLRNRGIKNRKSNNTNKSNISVWNIQYIPYLNGEFGTPVTLLEPINSSYNEAYFSIHNNTIFFCSNRNATKRRFDIYTETLPGTQTLKIKVTDALNNTPLQAKVSLEIITNNTKNAKDINTDKSGNAELSYKQIPNKVKLFIAKKGYLPYAKDLQISDILTSPVNIKLRPEKEKLFTIRSIYFDSNSDKIKKESFFFLKNFTRYLKKYPKKQINITGHTDLHGTIKYNRELSVKRARAVKKYLEKHGIKKTRLKISGAGKSHPVVNKKGAISDALNRRTEFKLIDGND